MDWLLDPQIWIALATLSTLEIVLGVDNLVFISIAVARLPPERRPAARRIGLALACVTRIMLLVSLAWLSRMDDTLFSVLGNDISIRDVVLIGGGLFLLVKGTMEIHNAVESAGDEAEPTANAVPAAFGWIVAQIAVIDIVFSLDSVITAVGMVDNVGVMIAAIVLAVVVMIFASNPIGEFIERHRTVKMLALSFLILVGVALVGDGLGMHIPRGYLYFAMAFSALVETLNTLANPRWRARRIENKRLRRERQQASD
jgi:predicted tellurium resistance membrane protein TerC